MYKYAAFQRDTGSGNAFTQWGDSGGDPNWYVLQGHGPDQGYYALSGIIDARIMDGSQASIANALNIVYDPTNGTISCGSIWRVGGGPTDPGSGLFKAISGAN